MRIRIYNTGFSSVVHRFEADPDPDCYDKQESIGTIAIELRGIKIGHLARQL